MSKPGDRPPHVDIRVSRGRDHADVCAAAAAAYPDDFDGRTLRLAVAMRGGVSLAVWIGGATAELDLIRSIQVRRDEDGGIGAVLSWLGDDGPPQAVRDRVEEYARLLADKSYHRIEVDVLAGASAGGLNSVLFAAAQRAGSPVSAALETWKDAGSISRLMRRPLSRGIPSVLSGDGFFYSEVLGRLASFYTGEHHPGLMAEAVSVDLAATVIDAQDSPNAAISRGEAGFRFTSGDGSRGNHVVSRGASAAAVAESLERLALAARSTSSFPGAFEPATIWSALRPGLLPAEVRDAEPWAGVDPGLSDPGAIDMSEAFLAHRPSSESQQSPFHVIDGGVFDNIPVRRAFRAIGPRSSSGPTRRALAYLDPSPPTAVTLPPRTSERRGDFMAIILKALASKQRVESAAEDEAEIAAFHTQQFIAIGRLEAFAALDATVSWELGDVIERERAYVRYRITEDSALLRRILDDPQSWQLHGDVRPRRSRNFVEVGRRTADDRFDTALTDELNMMSRADFASLSGVSRDWSAAGTTAAWMIGCVQWMERIRREHPSQAPDTRGVERHVRERSYAARLLARNETNRRLTRTLNALQDGRSGATAWLASNEPGPVVTWRSLDVAFRRLQVALDRWHDRAASLPSGDEFRIEWDEAPWGALRSAPRDSIGFPGSRTIAPLLAAIAPPLGSDTPLYFRLDADWVWGDAAETLAPALAKARQVHAVQLIQSALNDIRGEEAEDLMRARQILTPLEGDAASRVPARAKLAGTHLFNFGGFLSADWRVGDWWWGRADAAARMTDMLDDRPTDTTRQARMAGLVAAQRAQDEKVEGPDFTPGAGALRRLDPHYTHAVVAQLARVATRAATAKKGVAAAAIGVVIFLLRPVLLFLPAVVDPPRLAAAVLSLMAGLTVATVGEPFSVEFPKDWGRVVVLGVIIVGLALWSISGYVSAALRWGVVRKSAPESVGSLVDTSGYAAMRRSVLLAGIAAAASAAGVVTAMSRHAVVGILWFLLAAAFVSLSRRAAVSPRVSGLPPWTWGQRVSVLLAVSVVLLGLVWQFLGSKGFTLVSPGLSESAAWVIISFALSGYFLISGYAKRGLVSAGLALVAAASAAGSVWLSASLPVSWQGSWAEPLGWIIGVYLWANVLWFLPSITSLRSRVIEHDGVRPLRTPAAPAA